MTSSEDTLKDNLHGKSAVYLVDAPSLRSRLVFMGLDEADENNRGAMALIKDITDLGEGLQGKIEENAEKPFNDPATQHG